MPDTPQIRDFPSSSDSFQEKISEHPLFTRSNAGIRLQNALNAMSGLGDDAEEQFQKTLDELRDIPEEVVLELAQAFDDKCQPDAYPTKWGLVYLATELKHQAAYPFLRRLIFTPIPQERSKNPHSFSTVAEETILRTTAVEGLIFFLKNSKKDVIELLLESLKLPSISIARAAIQTLLMADLLDDKMRQRIKKILPEDRHYLMDIKPVKVEEVEQIKDPESHLKQTPEGVERKEKPSAPRFDSNNLIK